MRKQLLLTIAVLCAMANVQGKSKSEKKAELKKQKTEIVANGERNTNQIDGTSAVTVAESIGLGWNLGNQMDAFSDEAANETCWGNSMATQAAFYKLKAAGFSSVRIPVTWLGHFGEAPDYKIEERWMDRVNELVGYAEKAGLKAIINIHHDGSESKHWLNIVKAVNDSSANEAIKQQLTALWKQISNRFKYAGDFLIFETMNEIHDGGWGWGENRKDNGKQYAILNEWVQVCVDAIRSTGGANATRYIGVPGYCANPDLTMSNLVLPKDPAKNKLLVSVHFYDPYDYAIADVNTQWGHTALNEKKANWGDESNVTNIFTNLKKTYVDKGIPVYIGEFGSVHRRDEISEKFRMYYIEYVTKAARANHISIFFWDNGATTTGKESFGIINHSTGDFINNGKDVIDVLTKSYHSNDSNYTLETIYESAPAGR